MSDRSPCDNMDYKNTERANDEFEYLGDKDPSGVQKKNEKIQENRRKADENYGKKMQKPKDTHIGETYGNGVPKHSDAFF